MKIVCFRFYGELKDLLDVNHRHGMVRHRFKGKQSLKDRVESLGIPHTEIAMMLKGNNQLNFSYPVKDGDRICVFPSSWQDIKLPREKNLQPSPPPAMKFVLDCHLGKLANFLRVLGFDTLYSNSFDDPELAKIQEKEKRILLTRDKGLLQRRRVKWGCYLHSDSPRQQLREVVIRYDLHDRMQEFGRCPGCNHTLENVSKEEIIDRLEPLTKKHYDSFKICRSCDKIYWRGSHYEKLRSLVDDIKGN